MAAEKLCPEQNPKMWELGQVPHCPFCHVINETKRQQRQLAKDMTAKVINKMFKGMSFSNGNVLILSKGDIFILTYSETVYSSSKFTYRCDRLICSNLMSPKNLCSVKEKVSIRGYEGRYAKVKET